MEPARTLTEPARTYPEPKITYKSLSIPNNGHLDIYYTEIPSCPPEMFRFIHVKENETSYEIDPARIFVNRENFTKLSYLKVYDLKWYMVEQGVDEVKYVGNTFWINATKYKIPEQRLY